MNTRCIYHNVELWYILFFFSAGAEGEVIGILEFWVCLHPQALSGPQMNKTTRSVEAVRDTRGLEWAAEEPEVQ